MSLKNMKVIDNKYDKPRINTKNKQSRIGKKIKVQLGVKLKIGIKEKKTHNSIRSMIDVVPVADIGKNSLLILKVNNSGMLSRKLVNPNKVPREKRLWNITPVIK